MVRLMTCDRRTLGCRSTVCGYPTVGILKEFEKNTVKTGQGNLWYQIQEILTRFIEGTLLFRIPKRSKCRQLVVVLKGAPKRLPFKFKLAR